MCAETAEIAGQIGIKVLDKLLSQKEKTLIELQSVYINGIKQTIQTIIHIKKSTHKGKNFLQKFYELIGYKNFIPFDKGYDLKIINNLNREDITNEVIDYDAATKRIDLNKIKDLQGNTFIVEVRGRFSFTYNRIFDCLPNLEPYVNDEKFRKYKMKVIVFEKLYDCKDINLISIPIEVPYQLEFITKNLLTQNQLKIINLLEKHIHQRGKYERYRRSLNQQLGFDYEELEIAYGVFLGQFEKRVRAQFDKFISVSSSNCNVYISKCVIDFPRIGKGLPRIELKPTICFDFMNNDESVLDIDIELNKEILKKIADKIWSNIKKPKRTHPKKTL